MGTSKRKSDGIVAKRENGMGEEKKQPELSRRLSWSAVNILRGCDSQGSSDARAERSRDLPMTGSRLLRWVFG